jgi:hypothetical protein
MRTFVPQFAPSTQLQLHPIFDRHGNIGLHFLPQSQDCVRPQTACLFTLPLIWKDMRVSCEEIREAGGAFADQGV